MKSIHWFQVLNLSEQDAVDPILINLLIRLRNLQVTIHTKCLCFAADLIPWMWLHHPVCITTSQLANRTCSGITWQYCLWQAWDRLVYLCLKSAQFFEIFLNYGSGNARWLFLFSMVNGNLAFYMSHEWIIVSFGILFVLSRLLHMTWFSF